jgi:hypothetical protein
MVRDSHQREFCNTIPPTADIAASDVSATIKAKIVAASTAAARGTRSADAMPKGTRRAGQTARSRVSLAVLRRLDHRLDLDLGRLIACKSCSGSAFTQIF